MVSKNTNKLHPTINSSCTILIGKLNKTDTKYELDTEYFNESKDQKEIVIHLEEACTSVDREFVKQLLKTKLGEAGTFETNDITVEYKLLGITQHKAIHEMTDEDRLKKAEQYKDKGGKLFRQNKYEPAFYAFRTSVGYLSCLSDQDNALAKDLYVKICNNIAMCHMKSNNYDFVLESCSKVLAREDSNVKALYRRGIAYIELKDWDKAHVDLVKAATLEPSNQAIKKHVVIVEEHLKVQNERYKKLVQNMFR